MLFNGKLVYLSILDVIQWEFYISSIFHVIQWNLRLRSFGGGGDVMTRGHTDGQMDRLTSGNSPLCPTGRRPFGAAAQKGEWMDHRINGETN